MSLRKIGILTFLFSLFGNLIIWGYFPKLSVMSWTHPTLFALSLIGLVLAVIFSLEQIRNFTKLRSTQFGIGLMITGLMVVIILGVVNWLAFTYNKKWDLTKNKLYSLSEQTEKILDGLKEPVTIRVWTNSLESMGGSADLGRFLENYKIKGHGKIIVEIKNPNDEVEAASADQIKKSNVIIVRAQNGRENRIETFNDTKGEELITNAIIQTQKAGKKLVCFIAGHGELSINDNQAGGLSFVKERLNASSYETKEVMLATAETFPTDCEVTVIPGPVSAGTDKEISMLSDYLTKGGKLLALFGPDHPSWNAFVGKYGVEVQKDIILDMRQKPAILVVTKNFSNDVEITKSFDTNLVLLETSSIKVPTASSYEGAQIKPFVSTESWTFAKQGLLADIRDGRKLSTDKSGPMSVAVLITKPISTPDATKPESAAPSAKPKASPPALVPPNQGSLKSDFLNFIQPKAYAAGEAKNSQPSISGMPGMGGDLETDEDKKPANEMSLVVVGNHKFIANSFVSLLGNLDFFLNSISYLSKDQDLIGIRPRENTKVNLQLSNDSPKQVIATVLILAFLFGIGFFWSLTRKISTST